MANFLEKLFSGLTQQGIALPNGQFENANQAQNAVPDMPDFAKYGGMNAQAQPSSVQTPSFLQAMKSGPGGTPNAMSPQLSTKGKILTTLLSGAFGALAGAGQRTVGGGFQAGAQLPWEQAQFRQNAQKGELENEQMQQQMQFAPLLRMLGIQKSQAEIGKDTAQTNLANANAGAVPGEIALKQAQAEAANYKDDPNLGMIDLRTKQPVSDVGFVPLTADEAQVLGKQPGERVPLKVKNTASEITNRGFTTVNTEQGVYERNRTKGTMTRLGSNPRNVFAPENRIIQTADPNNPGETTFMKAGQAVKAGAAGPQSASVVVPRKAELAEVPTKIGDQKVAFNTALQHAQLLRQAAKALNNGDTRSLNSLSNRAATEFGDSGLTDFHAIAGAYSREITKMLSAGHMTDAEIASASATIPSNANYATIDKVLNSYTNLAQSKLTQLNKQKQAAISGSQHKGAGQSAPEIHYKIVNGQLVAQ